MPRPRIGISCDLNKRTFPEKPKERDRHVLMDAYILSIIKSGGVPFLLPSMTEENLTSDFVKNLDGLVVSGGGHDIDPLSYDEERHAKCAPSNAKRENFEISLIKEAMKLDMPILGICGGMQAINVAAGGTLFQDIPSFFDNSIQHKPDEESTYSFHTIKIKSSMLEEIFSSSSELVNSHHHQSVKKVPESFRVNAFSSDGVIEGIESIENSFVLGVQWHPESLFSYMEDNFSHSKKLFSFFVDFSCSYAKKKG
ncbi:MAG: gamma-glutamyl-gamma-aminobutyrate hydrolase family protein [Nitrospinota bacterium]|nr:gamma-glutamyl-gamma-aminobutyrate hydrolase family protein [Nitrospinota bacterium]